jgi:hypothetical protein
MNISRNDSKVKRLSVSIRHRESVLGRWRSKSTHEIEAARELNVSVAIRQVNDWLGGSLSHFGSDPLLPWSLTGGHNEKHWSQMNIS